MLVAPCAAQRAPAVDAVLGEVPDELPLMRNTVPFDTYGIPTISVPCGIPGGGPAGRLQIAAAPLAEATVVALAHAYEQAVRERFDWARREPPIG